MGVAALSSLRLRRANAEELALAPAREHHQQLRQSNVVVPLRVEARAIAGINGPPESDQDQARVDAQVNTTERAGESPDAASRP